MKTSTIVTLTLLMLAFAGPTHGFLLVNLPGNTEYEGWSGLTSANNPGYPGFADPSPWPDPIFANETGSAGNAGLDKISGPGNPAGGSIYTFAAPSTFEVVNNDPLAGLETVVFQIDMGNGSNGNLLDAAPVLNLNGGSQALAADFSLIGTGNFAFTNPTDPSDSGSTTLLAYQWDLSTWSGSISSYQIVWTIHDHSTIYAMQLNSGDQFAQVVPEPGAALLLMLGLPLLFRRQRSYTARRTLNFR